MKEDKIRQISNKMLDNSHQMMWIMQFIKERTREIQLSSNSSKHFQNPITIFKRVMMKLMTILITVLVIAIVIAIKIMGILIKTTLNKIRIKGEIKQKKKTMTK